MKWRLIPLILLVIFTEAYIVEPQVSDSNSRLVEITEENVQQIRSLHRLEVGSVNDLSWSSDSAKIAVATGTEIAILEIGDDLIETARINVGEFVRAISFVPNSPYLTVNNYVYDTRDFTVVEEFDGIIFDVSHQGSLLAVANSNEIQLYDFSSDEIVSDYSVDSISLENCETACYIADITISSDDAYLAFSTPLNEDAVLGLAALNNLFSNDVLGYAGLTFNPTGSILAAWEGEPGFLGDKVLLTSIPEYAQLAEIELCGGSTPDFSRNGRILVVGSVDCTAVNSDEARGVLVFFNVDRLVEAGKADLSSAIHFANSGYVIGQTEFSPNYSYLAVTDESRHLTLWGLQ